MANFARVTCTPAVIYWSEVSNFLHFVQRGQTMNSLPSYSAPYFITIYAKPYKIFATDCRKCFCGWARGGEGGGFFRPVGFCSHSLSRMAIYPLHEKLLLIGWPLLKLDECFPGCRTAAAVTIIIKNLEIMTSKYKSALAKFSAAVCEWVWVRARARAHGMFADQHSLCRRASENKKGIINTSHASRTLFISPPNWCFHFANSNNKSISDCCVISMNFELRKCICELRVYKLVGCEYFTRDFHPLANVNI